MALLKAKRITKKPEIPAEPSAVAMSSRLHPTAMDTMVAAIAPGFIIGMICCLVFFLIIITCRGEFTIRLMYLLGLYTFASVLVARIAIERSRAVSSAYMGVLGAATLLVVMQFVQFPGILAVLSLPLTIAFLVLIGFLADRITFDCTLIDDREDSSGVGLLQSLGVIDNPRKKSTQRKRRHNPGVWVLYFALLAIPLFGLGQLAIPASETESRRAAYWFLFGYLFFSLGLLVSTSFLGLRRYLRQRKVEMPLSLNMIWIGGGIVGVAVVLSIVSLLPLPSGSQGLLDIPFRIETKTSLRPSLGGWGREGKNEESEDRKASKTPGDKSSKNPSDKTASGGKGNEPSDAKSDDKSKSQSSKSQPSKNDPNSKVSQPSNEKGDSKKNSSNESQNSSKEKNEEPSKSPNQQQDAPNQQQDIQSKTQAKKQQLSNTERSLSVSLSGGLGNLLRWIVSGLLIIAIAYAVVRYRDELHLAWLDFVAWWRGLFGDRSDESPTNEVASIDKPANLVRLRAFSDFENPFSRKASRWNANQILLHIFEAIEAWGRERQLARSAEETPEEYLRRLASKFPVQSESLRYFTQLYNRTAYANASADANEVKRLTLLWDWLLAQRSL